VSKLTSISEAEASIPPESRPLRPLQSHTFCNLPNIVHGMTRRVSGLGKADGNVGYGTPRDQTDAWQMRGLWGDAIGFPATSIVGLRQVHGAEVAVVSAPDAGKGAKPGSDPLARADALITRDQGVTLMTLHADCLPIFIVDPRTPAVAAIHAGWRGTVDDVAGATIKVLSESFGSEPAELLAFFGPSIGSCCYEVGAEVVEVWGFRAGDEAAESLVHVNGSTALDLRAANRMLLKRAGVKMENVEVMDVCTKCNRDEWFSHRGQGPETGRFAAFIGLTGSGS
jgi:polyphenol oxidase